MLTLHHIPVCPFCQRVEILLGLKGLDQAVARVPVDITVPRSPALLALTPGNTSLPVLETESGAVIESLVILRYLEARFPAPRIARRDPWQAAVEDMLVAMEGPFATAGYRLVLNQDRAARAPLIEALLTEYRRLDAFLSQHSPEGPFLFEAFGLAELVFTPLFQRFWFLEYYEGFELAPTGFARVRRWKEACEAHPAAQQVQREEIVKSYYDYARGQGNGGLLPGRTRSSFVLSPHWRDRPWPPRDKYGPAASDGELGLG